MHKDTSTSIEVNKLKKINEHMVKNNIFWCKNNNIIISVYTMNDKSVII